MDFILRRNMNIGTGTAENDGEFLTECFLKTPEYCSILDFTDKKNDIIGTYWVWKDGTNKYGRKRC